MRDLGIENGQISANRTKPVEFFLTFLRVIKVKLPSLESKTWPE